MSQMMVDDYEFNYSASGSENLDFYTKKVAEGGGTDGRIVNEIAQDFIIERCFKHSEKNLKTLRKNKLITWLEWAKIKFGTTKVATFVDMAILSELLAPLVASIALMVVLVGTSLMNANVMIVGMGTFLLAPIFVLLEHIEEKILFRFPKTLHDKVFRVSVPYRYRFLYEELKNFDKNELTEEELKRLLEIASHYPSDVDEKIAKLMNLKRESKNKDVSAALLLQDTDQMIEELMQLRESVDTEWLYEEMTEIFQAVKARRMNEEAERGQAEEVSEIVSELANVSEFLSSEREARTIDDVEEVLARAGSDGVLRV